MKNKTRWRILDLYRGCEFILCLLFIAMIFGFSLGAAYYLEKLFNSASDGILFLSVMIGIILTFIVFGFIFEFYMLIEDKLYYWALNEK